MSVYVRPTPKRIPKARFQPFGTVIPKELDTLPEGIKWFLLIRDMEDFSEATGWGLGLCWQYVWRDDYRRAREKLDDLLAEWPSE